MALVVDSLIPANSPDGPERPRAGRSGLLVFAGVARVPCAWHHVRCLGQATPGRATVQRLPIISLTNQEKQDKIDAYPEGVSTVGMETVGKDEITNRLKRVEGQIRGLQRMIEEQRECEAILTQLMAARAALDRVGLLVADNFVQQCVLTEDGDLARQRVARVLELVFSRFSIPGAEESTLTEDPIN